MRRAGGRLPQPADDTFTGGEPRVSAGERRRRLKRASTAWAASCLLFVALLSLAPAPPIRSGDAGERAARAPEGQANEGALGTRVRSAPCDLPRDPRVVLFRGTSPGTKREWNTGVWPAWGMGDDVVLAWAGKGVKVHKECDVSCHITQDQDSRNSADAVVMELINHAKFNGRGRAAQFPFPWPPRASEGGPALIGQFYFESTDEYHDFVATDEVLDRVDFTISPQASSDVQITSICPWGRPREAYLAPPPRKERPDRLVAFFGQGLPPEAKAYIDPYLDAFPGSTMHRFGYRRNSELPWGNDPLLETRIDFFGTYKFVLVFDWPIEDDWVQAPFSTALLAGSVPIYVGAPNIDEFAPGKNSFVNAAKFNSPADLAEFVVRAGNDDALYRRFFEWKRDGLAASFHEKLDLCYHYGECRVCHQVREELCARQS